MEAAGEEVDEAVGRLCDSEVAARFRMRGIHRERTGPCSAVECSRAAILLHVASGMKSAVGRYVVICRLFAVGQKAVIGQ